MIATTRPPWAIPLVAAIFVAALAPGNLAVADSVNRIRAITFTEDSGTTQVRIAGSEVATFTVYKLERPSRVVLDLARAELTDELRGHEAGLSLAANTWAVGAVGAQPLSDGGKGVRVIVSLARPGRYDVKIDGKDLLVLVSARDAAPVQVSAAEAARVKASAEEARRDSVAARAEAEHLRAEKERLTASSAVAQQQSRHCLLYTSPSPRDGLLSRMPSSA